MMLPMIALGVTLVLSHEATKDIGKIAEYNESNIEYIVEQTFKELREATKNIGLIQTPSETSDAQHD